MFPQPPYPFGLVGSFHNTVPIFYAVRQNEETALSGCVKLASLPGAVKSRTMGNRLPKLYNFAMIAHAGNAVTVGG